MIALLTDFGSDSHYIALMKAKIRTINTKIEILDITHSIEKFNIKQASFILMTCFREFPEGTIFVAVVDPGVGSERKAIIIEAGDYYFIGPNNGIFSFIPNSFPNFKLYEINSNIFNKVSNTFHGKDIFAPSAAYLSNDLNILNNFNTLPPDKLMRLTNLYPKIIDNRIIGEIIYFDSYGNAITNIHNSLINNNISIYYSKIIIKGLNNYYSESKKNELLAYIGSSDYLELGVRENSFRDLYYENEKYEITII